MVDREVRPYTQIRSGTIVAAAQSGAGEADHWVLPALVGAV